MTLVNVKNAMLHNIFESSQVRLDGRKHNDITSETEMPYFASGIPNTRTEALIKGFFNQTRELQASILYNLTAMTASDDRATKRAGYEHLRTILTDNRARSDKTATQISGYLHENACKSVDRLLIKYQNDSVLTAQSLGDVELLVMHSSPYLKDNQSLANAITNELSTRKLKTIKNPRYKFSDLEAIVKVRRFELEKDYKARKGNGESMTLREVVQNFKGTIGGWLLRNSSVQKDWINAKHDTDKILFKAEPKADAKKLLAKFGTWRSNARTDRAIIDTSLRMIHNTNDEFVQNGYSNLITLLSKGGDVQEKALAYIYGSVCNAIGAIRDGSRDPKANMDRLSNFELALFKAMSPTGILVHPTQCGSVASALETCLSKRKMVEMGDLADICKKGELKTDQLITILENARDQAKEAIKSSLLYIKPESPAKKGFWSRIFGAKFNEAKAKAAKEKIFPKIEDVIKFKSGSRKWRSAVKDLFRKAEKFGNDANQDAAFVSAMVKATKSEHGPTSRTGYYFLMKLIQNPKTRESAMNTLLEHALHKAHKKKKSMQQADIEVSKEKIEAEVLKTLSLPSVLALQYFDESRVPHSTLLKARSNKGEQKSIATLATHNWSPEAALWCLFRERSNLDRGNDQIQNNNRTDHDFQRWFPKDFKKKKMSEFRAEMQSRVEEILKNESEEKVEEKIKSIPKPQKDKNSGNRKHSVSSTASNADERLVYINNSENKAISQNIENINKEINKVVIEKQQDNINNVNGINQLENVENKNEHNNLSGLPKYINNGDGGYISDNEEYNINSEEYEEKLLQQEKDLQSGIINANNIQEILEQQDNNEDIHDEDNQNKAPIGDPSLNIEQPNEAKHDQPET